MFMGSRCSVTAFCADPVATPFVAVSVVGTLGQLGEPLAVANLSFTGNAAPVVSDVRFFFPSASGPRSRPETHVGAPPSSQTSWPLTISASHVWDVSLALSSFDMTAQNLTFAGLIKMADDRLYPGAFVKTIGLTVAAQCSSSLCSLQSDAAVARRTLQHPSGVRILRADTALGALNGTSATGGEGEATAVAVNVQLGAWEGTGSAASYTLNVTRDAVFPFLVNYSDPHGPSLRTFLNENCDWVFSCDTNLAFNVTLPSVVQAVSTNVSVWWDGRFDGESGEGSFVADLRVNALEWQYQDGSYDAIDGSPWSPLVYNTDAAVGSMISSANGDVRLRFRGAALSQWMEQYSSTHPLQWDSGASLRLLNIMCLRSTCPDNSTAATVVGSGGPRMTLPAGVDASSMAAALPPVTAGAARNRMAFGVWYGAECSWRWAKSQLGSLCPDTVPMQGFAAVGPWFSGSYGGPPIHATLVGGGGGTVPVIDGQWQGGYAAGGVIVNTSGITAVDVTVYFEGLGEQQASHFQLGLQAVPTVLSLVRSTGNATMAPGAFVATTTDQCYPANCTVTPPAPTIKLMSPPSATDAATVEAWAQSYASLNVSEALNASKYIYAFEYPLKPASLVAIRQRTAPAPPSGLDAAAWDPLWSGPADSVTPETQLLLALERRFSYWNEACTWNAECGGGTIVSPAAVHVQKTITRANLSPLLSHYSAWSAQLTDPGNASAGPQASQTSYAFAEPSSSQKGLQVGTVSLGAITLFTAPLRAGMDNVLAPVVGATYFVSVTCRRTACCHPAVHSGSPAPAIVDAPLNSAGDSRVLDPSPNSGWRTSRSPFFVGCNGSAFTAGSNCTVAGMCYDAGGPSPSAPGGPIAVTWNFQGGNTGGHHLRALSTGGRRGHHMGALGQTTYSLPGGWLMESTLPSGSATEGDTWTVRFDQDDQQAYVSSLNFGASDRPDFATIALPAAEVGPSYTSPLAAYGTSQVQFVCSLCEDGVSSVANPIDVSNATVSIGATLTAGGRFGLTSDYFVADPALPTRPVLQPLVARHLPRQAFSITPIGIGVPPPDVNCTVYFRCPAGYFARVDAALDPYVATLHFANRNASYGDSTRNVTALFSVNGQPFVFPVFAAGPSVIRRVFADPSLAPASHVTALTVYPMFMDDSERLGMMYPFHFNVSCAAQRCAWVDAADMPLHYEASPALWDEDPYAAYTASSGGAATPVNRTASSRVVRYLDLSVSNLDCPVPLTCVAAPCQELNFTARWVPPLSPSLPFVALGYQSIWETARQELLDNISSTLGTWVRVPIAAQAALSSHALPANLSQFTFATLFHDGGESPLPPAAQWRGSRWAATNWTWSAGGLLPPAAAADALPGGRLQTLPSAAAPTAAAAEAAAYVPGHLDWLTLSRFYYPAANSSAREIAAIRSRSGSMPPATAAPPFWYRNSHLPGATRLRVTTPWYAANVFVPAAYSARGGDVANHATYLRLESTCASFCDVMADTFESRLRYPFSPNANSSTPAPAPSNASITLRWPFSFPESRTIPFRAADITGGPLEVRCPAGTFVRGRVGPSAASSAAPVPPLWNDTRWTQLFNDSIMQAVFSSAAESLQEARIAARRSVTLHRGPLWPVPMSTADAIWPANVTLDMSVSPSVAAALREPTVFDNRAFVAAALNWSLPSVIAFFAPIGAPFSPSSLWLSASSMPPQGVGVPPGSAALAARFESLVIGTAQLLDYSDVEVVFDCLPSRCGRDASSHPGGDSGIVTADPAVLTSAIQQPVSLTNATRLPPNNTVPMSGAGLVAGRNPAMLTDWLLAPGGGVAAGPSLSSWEWGNGLNEVCDWQLTCGPTPGAPGSTTTAASVVDQTSGTTAIWAALGALYKPPSSSVPPGRIIDVTRALANTSVPAGTTVSWSQPPLVDEAWPRLLNWLSSQSSSVALLTGDTSAQPLNRGDPFPVVSGTPPLYNASNFSRGSPYEVSLSGPAGAPGPTTSIVSVLDPLAWRSSGRWYYLALECWEVLAVSTPTNTTTTTITATNTTTTTTTTSATNTTTPETSATTTATTTSMTNTVINTTTTGSLTTTTPPPTTTMSSTAANVTGATFTTQPNQTAFAPPTPPTSRRTIPTPPAPTTTLMPGTLPSDTICTRWWAALSRGAAAGSNRSIASWEALAETDAGYGAIRASLASVEVSALQLTMNNITLPLLSTTLPWPALRDYARSNDAATGVNGPWFFPATIAPAVRGTPIRVPTASIVLRDTTQELTVDAFAEAGWKDSAFLANEPYLVWLHVPNCSGSVLPIAEMHAVGDIPNKVLEAAAAKAVASVVPVVMTTGLVMNAGAAMDGQGIVILMSLNCGKTQRALPANFRLLSPFALNDTFLGMLLGNTIATLAALLLHRIALMAAIKIRPPRPDGDASGSGVTWLWHKHILRYPALSVRLTTMLYQGTGYAAAQLATYPTNMAEFHVGAVGLIYFVAVPFLLVAYTYKKVRASFHLYNYAKSRLLTPGEVRELESDPDLEAADPTHLVASRSSPADSASAFADPAATSGVQADALLSSESTTFGDANGTNELRPSPAMRVLGPYMLPYGKWFHKSQRNQFGPLFTSHRRKESWWGVIPMLNSVIMIFIAAVRSSSRTTCAALYGLAASLFFLLAIMYLVVRPLRTPLTNVLAAASVMCTGLVLSDNANRSLTPSAAPFSASVYIVQITVMIVRQVYAAFLFFFEPRKCGPYLMKESIHKFPTTTMDGGEKTDAIGSGAGTRMRFGVQLDDADVEMLQAVRGRDEIEKLNILGGAATRLDDAMAGDRPANPFEDDLPPPPPPLQPVADGRQQQPSFSLSDDDSGGEDVMSDFNAAAYGDHLFGNNGAAAPASLTAAERSRLLDEL